MQRWWRVVEVLAATLAAAALLAGCASKPAAADAAVLVQVTRDGAQWTADYSFARDVPVWAFPQSALARTSGRPWRPDHWTVQTPGVVLERVGPCDVLRAKGGGTVPRQVRIAMRPFSDNLVAANNPTLVFSNGTVALYSRQFDVVALPSMDAARALPADLNGLSLDEPPMRVSYLDRAGPVLAEGRRQPGVTLGEIDTYVVFGPARGVESADLATVIDPGLPGWIVDEMAAFTPRMIGLYAARMGPRSGARPTIITAWSGPVPGVVSLGGSVIPGMVVMNLSGARLQAPDAGMLERVRWLVAHESAHFWLGQEVHYLHASEAWITEGGADLMAWRGLAQTLPGFDAEAGLKRAVAECIPLARGRPVAGARLRGEHRAYYACGTVFGLVAEAAIRRARPGADFLDFIGPLVQARRPEGVLGAEAWRAELTRVSGDASLAEDIRRITDDGVDDPAALIASLFQRAGVTIALP
jgi:hypothetical protein